MGLSNDLLSQFAKLTKDDNNTKKEDTVYGTVVTHNDTKYVKLDGSEVLTPVISTTEIEDQNRVMVMVKNHTAVVTGNISSPSASTDSVKQVSDRVAEFHTIIADKADIDELDAQTARINSLVAENAVIKGQITASEAEISAIKSDNVTINEKLTANEADIKKLQTDKIDAAVVEADYATIKSLEATDAKINNLSSTFGDFEVLTTNQLAANKASIDDLETKKLNAEDAEIKYANIDFSNIGKTAIEYFYSTSGLIKNVVVGDQTITGELVGVTIKGDLIEGNTIVADKLVIKGTDGLYYKLNTDGITTEAEQTDYNSLNGSVIRANSITAEKIAVSDLVAFDATIAGFKIEDTAIYSGVKNSATNTTRGIYLGKDGQIAFGDGNNYIKYYKDETGAYKLAVSADSMTFSTGTSVKDAIDAVENKVDSLKSVYTTVVEYQVGISGTTAPTGEWSLGVPTVPIGQYLWTRTIITYTDQTTTTLYSVSSMGEKGEKGDTGATGPQGPTGPTGPTGNGVKSTSVTYQAWPNGTSTPTGTWSSSPPTTTASAPYLWTRTIITYTNGTTSTSYSVGSTPEGIVIGGRNLYYLHDMYRRQMHHVASYSVEDGEITLVANGNDLYIGEVLAAGGKWGPEFGPLMDIEGASYVTINISNPLFNKNFYNFLDSDKKALSIYTYWNISSGRITVPSGAKYLNLRVGYGAAVSGTTYKLRIKVEKGNKATDWSPAPEDVDAAITTVDSRITQEKDSIINTVSSTYQRKDAMGNYSTTEQMNSVITQTANSITNTVSSTYTTKTEFNNLQVGGRNLIINSKINETSNNYGFGYRYGITLENNTTYTFTTNGRSNPSGNTEGKHLRCYLYENSWSIFSLNFGISETVNTTRSYTFTTPSNVAGVLFHVGFYWFPEGGDRTGNATVNWCKLEKGNKATDWTPAPEDVDAAINTVDEKFSNYATTASLGLYIKKDPTSGELKSAIEAIADTINITARGGLNLSGNRFTVSSSNFTLTAAGNLWCNSANIENANLTNCNVTGGKIKIQSSSADWSFINLIYEGTGNSAGNKSDSLIQAQQCSFSRYLNESLQSVASLSSATGLILNGLGWTITKNGMPTGNDTTAYCNKNGDMLCNSLTTNGNISCNSLSATNGLPEIINNANGRAYRFSSGLQICTKQWSGEKSCTVEWGSLYESSSPIDFGYWAANFSETPKTCVTSTVNDTGGGAGCWIENHYDISSSYAGRAYIARPTSIAYVFTLNIIAIGKWK